MNELSLFLFLIIPLETFTSMRFTGHRFPMRLWLIIPKTFLQGHEVVVIGNIAVFVRVIYPALMSLALRHMVLDSAHAVRLRKTNVI